MSSTAVEIPGYVAGTWAIDPVHSEVSFTVRHMMVSKVRGRFDTFEGTITTGATPLDSTVTASVDLSSINTGQEQRDAHIRSADFFETDKHTHMTFASTGVRVDGGDFLLDGDLTLKGVTKPVTFKLDVNGIGYACVEKGKGPLLLLGHGTFGGKQLMLPQLDHLSRLFRTVAFDWRGHGESGPLVEARGSGGRTEGLGS